MRRTFLLRYAPSAWHSPTVVVLLPSPSGVGEMPPTTTAAQTQHRAGKQQTARGKYGQANRAERSTACRRQVRQLVTTAAGCCCLGYVAGAYRLSISGVCKGQVCECWSGAETSSCSGPICTLVRHTDATGPSSEKHAAAKGRSAQDSWDCCASTGHSYSMPEVARPGRGV